MCSSRGSRNAIGELARRHVTGSLNPTPVFVGQVRAEMLAQTTLPDPDHRTIRIGLAVEQPIQKRRDRRETRQMLATEHGRHGLTRERIERLVTVAVLHDDQPRLLPVELRVQGDRLSRRGERLVVVAARQ